MVAMGYHPKYPRDTILRMQTSLSPWDTGPDINIRILPFIMFNSTSSLGLRNNFDTRKRYKATRALTKKRVGKMRIFTFTLI